jgi:hypothetical protein
MALWRDMTTGVTGPGQGDYDPYGDLSSLVRQIAPGIGTAAQTALQPQLSRPDDSFAAYMADPLARSDADIQQRAAAGPPSAGQSLADLGSLVTPYLAGAAPGGSLSAGAKGARAGAASIADTVAKFPEYAESYPANVPGGTPTLDPKKGTYYPAKTLSPEAEAFAAERTRIAADMAKNGYTPYYDPAQRFPVDPANYPTPFDTATITPAKPATTAAHMANIGSPEARANLQTAYQRGSEMPNTSNWYDMGQLERDFVALLGPEAGRKAFQDRFAAGMAATTGGANPESNYLMSTYGNYLRGQGLPYPSASHEVPYPVGGRYGMTNIQQHQKIFDQGGYTALGATNPKRLDFASAFLGNPNAMTMDEQMTSGMTPGVSVPPANTYGLYTGVGREEAAKAGVPPQNFQDVAWAGFKNMKNPNYTQGQPMIDVINESIERTHRLTGMPKDEIVRRGVIGGQIPMYGLLGAVGLGAASQQ